jgi:toxin YhaV
MTGADEAYLTVHGWTIFAHPLFLDQLQRLTRQVAASKQRDPLNFHKKNAAKQLAAISKLAFDVIAQDPSRPEYRQGNTLGEEHRHWFRAKFFQQYRLFFRYHARSKIIVFAWVNDDDTKRAYESGDDESGDDAYRVFRKMLANGSPPDNWDALLAASLAQSSCLLKANNALHEPSDVL